MLMLNTDDTELKLKQTVKHGIRKVLEEGKNEGFGTRNIDSGSYRLLKYFKVLYPQAA